MIFLLIEAPEDRLMAYQHIKRSSFVTRPGDKLFGARAVAERLGIDLRSSVGAEIPLWIRFWPGLALRSTLDRFARAVRDGVIAYDELTILVDGARIVEVLTSD